MSKLDAPFLSVNINSHAPPWIPLSWVSEGVLEAPFKICGDFGLEELLTVFEHIHCLHPTLFLPRAGLDSGCSFGPAILPIL